MRILSSIRDRVYGSRRREPLRASEALARELGYDGPADGSLEMDNWLHSRVMADLAVQGGHVP